MPTQRIDIHRPSATDFDPEAYDLVGTYDAHPRYGNGRLRSQAVAMLTDQGMSLGAGSASNCGHCGARIRYGALLLRRDVREYIFVGETCLDNRFGDLTAHEFQALRTQARLNVERANRRESRAALVEAHPTLAWLAYPDVLSLFASDFLKSVAHAFRKNGVLSERQIAAAERAIVKDSARYYDRLAREQRWASERAESAPVPIGRTAILGEVIAVKWISGYTPGSPDIKILHVKSDVGWRVRLTCPSAISHVEKGNRVALTATISVVSDDPTFGIGKRPSRAEIVS